MTSRKIRQLETQVKSIDKRVRKIEAGLELLPVVTSFQEWTSLMERDKKILYSLHKYGLEGTNTLQLAKDLGLNNPETSGRTIILRRLYRIQKVSLQLKGMPLVVRVSKKWRLNFDDYVFRLEVQKLR